MRTSAFPLRPPAAREARVASAKPASARPANGSKNALHLRLRRCARRFRNDRGGGRCRTPHRGRLPDHAGGGHPPVRRPDQRRSSSRSSSPRSAGRCRRGSSRNRRRNSTAGLPRELKAVPGVQELLDRIDGPLCVCSNSSSERLRITLERTRLWDRFKPYIFSAGEVGTKKPKPDSERLPLRPRAVRLRSARDAGDRGFGVRRARRRKAAGARVIGFTGGRTPGRAMPTS